MQVIEPTYSIIRPVCWYDELEHIEFAARNCYQSECKGDPHGFVTMLKNKKHHAMLEFGRMAVRFTTDRATSHQIVRHRLFSFAQESSYYCRYTDGLRIIKPTGYDEWPAHVQETWYHAMEHAEAAYLYMLEKGLKQQARNVLPNSTSTRLVVQGNFRAWRTFFETRAMDARNHIDMLDLVQPLHDEVQRLCPEVFL